MALKGLRVPSLLEIRLLNMFQFKGAESIPGEQCRIRDMSSFTNPGSSKSDNKTLPRFENSEILKKDIGII